MTDVRRILLVVALGAPACTIDMSEPDLSSADQQVGTYNRLATNRLATNRLATNRLATNRLATNSLGQLAALSDTAQILETADGREVYSYVVSCALGPEVTIHANIAGAADTAADANYKCVGGACEFYGALGLAPAWLDRRLNAPGKGWISACLFARSNEFDTAAAISLRGRNAGLIVGTEEANLYSVEEGAFYGNVFIDDPDPAVQPDWHACRGRGQASGEFGGLSLRDCAEENPDNPGFTYCGFKYAGDCGDYSPEFPSPYACRTSTAEGYGDCHEDAGTGRWGGGNPKYREVITSFVAPT